MAAVLLVVDNSAIPTAGDAVLKTILESLGHTVTYRSDSDAEDITGMNMVVVAESVGGAAIGSKYSTVAIPVVTHEQSYLDDLGFCATGDISTTAAQTQITWIDTEPIADGPYGTFSGTDTLYSAGSIVGWFNVAGKAAGVKQIAGTVAASTTEITCAVAQRGAPLLIGAAAARRVFIWPHDAGATVLTADAENSMKNAYTWALQGPAVAWITA